MQYLKNRLSERDTQAVLGAAAYTVVRAFTPPQYAPILDVIASLLGFGVAATPSTRP